VGLCGLAFGWEMVVLAQGGDAALEAFFERWGLIPADLVAAVQAADLVAAATAGLVTHLFLHASWLHLFGNLLFLWIFAPNVEDRLGRPLFLGLYLLGGAAAAMGHILVDPSSDVPMIGASGAISAVLGAYVVLFPRARIQSLVFLVFYYELIAVPSWIVLGFWFVLQLIDGLAALGPIGATDAGIAFWAHIGGFAAGVALAIPLRHLRPPAREPAAAPAAPPPAPAPPPPPPAR
jgi:rhomboid family protein